MTGHDVTALVLAGGRGARMGGVDKGLQMLDGTPLVGHVLQRLRTQRGVLPRVCMINANRHLQAYERFGVAVVPDEDPEAFAGPLAGFLTGLEHCPTPWMLTAPCDTPLLAPDLLERLSAAIVETGADLAMASAPEQAGEVARPQPVFCLLPKRLSQDLRAFLQAGGRKIDVWTARHRCALVPFDRPGDDPRAFLNINTLAELQALEPSPPDHNTP
jgi:molybdenum cofactor guanylyltransferase